MASVSSCGNIQEFYIRKFFIEDISASVEICLTGHEEHFIVSDLDDVCFRKSPCDCSFCGLFVFPERRTEIGVKGDNVSGIFCDLKGEFGSFSARLIGQRQRPEMEYTG